MVISAIKTALENMDKKYCKPSQTYYSMGGVDESTKEYLVKEKYFERPFAYEFYHQLRKLIDNGDVDFGGPIIQAEVDKRYQHYFKNGKIPDFILHVPNTQQNLAVIEFKLASYFSRLEHDFKKLIQFKNNEDLKYTYIIEVIIGNETSLRNAKRYTMQLKKSEVEEITIIKFDTDPWTVND